MQQLEAQEGRFAESLVSLQFRKAARMAKTLWAYTALLSIQDLLLEELSVSETLTKTACAQILESHSPVSVGLGVGDGLHSHSWALSGATSGSPPSSGRPPVPSVPQGEGLLRVQGGHLLGSTWYLQPKAALFLCL